ncbi:MAG: FAD-binding protein [Anaerolineales bacterium]|nr:FAD-binding protein [Anaerolineales bacterium]
MTVTTFASAPLLRELEDKLQTALGGRAHFDAYTRALYSNDGSLHEITPLGVAFPKHTDELQAIVETAAALKVPLLPRGAGTSLAGQTVGAALVVDCARHLNHILSLDPDTQTALVEPGVVCAQLNRRAAAHGLTYGPDPASADRATFGGMIGNNATGAHSIRYGMTADHVAVLDVVLGNGSLARFGPLDEAAARAKANAATREGRIYQTLLNLRDSQAETIRRDWPHTWRRASGYNLNYLTGYSPGTPPAWFDTSTPYPPLHGVNLAPVVTGSEGTLVVIQRARVRLAPLPKATVVVLLAFDSAAEACDATPEVLATQPAAIELLPAQLLALARSIPDYARRLTFAPEGEKTLLAVEYAGASLDEALAGAGPLAGRGTLLADTALQGDLWAIRKVGMGLLMNRPGRRKAIDFVEDMSVPVERLGEFVRRLDALLAAHGTAGVWYAHASAGCLHMRPLLDLTAPDGVRDLRAIAEEASAVVADLHGVMSGEHGDGLSRSEFIERMFGPALTGAFRAVKHAFDPAGLLNPGKIVLDAGARPLDKALRYGPAYTTTPFPTVFAFRREGGLAGAVEGCVGAGVCRQTEGVMCPSFQATREEQHLTRGRANALRAALAGRLPAGALTSPQMRAVLDLCLECKGCKAECPTGVDMARIKAEFLNAYHAQHGVPLRSRLFGHINSVSRWSQRLAPLANWGLRLWPVRRGLNRLGITDRRPLPTFARQRFSQWFHRRGAPPAGQPVVLFVDTYTEYNHPQLGQAAVRVLEAAGCEARLVRQQGCCGRPMISKGLLGAAKAAADRNLAALAPYAAQGLPILGLEPSCLLTLRDEYLEFFPEDSRAQQVAQAALLIEEFLTQPGPDGLAPVARLPLRRSEEPWLLHGHCHAKSLVGTSAPRALLRAAGAQVADSGAGCCGMAGSFGYESEHVTLSLAIGELKLFPAVRAGQAAGVRVAAQGVSCRAQIAEGAGVAAVHPIELIAAALEEKPGKNQY